MALLRKCLVEVRTRGLCGEPFAAAMVAAGPDTVFPPLDERVRPPASLPYPAERAVRGAPGTPRRPGLND